MNICILAALILFAISIVSSILFVLSLKKSYYNFRNIVFAGITVYGIIIGICILLIGTNVFSLEIKNHIIPDITMEKLVNADTVDFQMFTDRIIPVCIKNITIFNAIILVLVCIIVSSSNISLIMHEGLKPRNVMGVGLEFIFILATLSVFCLDEMIFEPLAASGINNILLDRCSGFLVFLYSVILYSEIILVGIVIMGWMAARQKPKYDKDFIIIPGCSIRRDGGLLPLLKGRTNRAIKYAWQQEIACGKKVLYVPSGGQGPDEIMSEGSAMEMYLISHSAEENEVFAEKKSRNTYENFLFSKKIIEGLNKDAKVAFATTNYHVLRCGMLAHKAGMETEGIASDTKWYFWPNGFAREIVAIFVLTKKYHIIMVAVIGLLSIFLY